MLELLMVRGVIGLILVCLVEIIVANLPSIIVARAVAVPIRQGKTPQVTGEIGVALARRAAPMPVSISLHAEISSDVILCAPSPSSPTPPRRTMTS